MKEIDSPKSRNLEANSSEIAQNHGTLHSAFTETTAAVTETNSQSPEGIISRRRIRDSNSHESMYRATVEGDLVAAEILLQRDPNLASDEISEEGDRALHVAAAFKHQELVRKLVKIMNPSDLILLDGHGCTACCYAAIAGAVEIADLMMRENASVATAHDCENKTPLYKAAFRGNAKMVSYFLKSVKLEVLSKDEWFDLLLASIRRETYGVALEIVSKNEQLATMRNDEGTALHMLATKRFDSTRVHWKKGVMRKDMRVLAKKLWEGVESLGQGRAQELMKKPSILHAAAEQGNVELITMITQTYPHLVWNTDNQGYTIFHTAVKYRQEILFQLIDEIGARKDSIAVSQDKNGNNILHLAAEIGVMDQLKFRIPAFQLQREITWFENVKAVVPPLCLETRNKNEHTPHELFEKEHENMMKMGRTWTRETSDSWMLISTLFFSVVFASAFAVPGGYDQGTGIPILYKSKWFTCFVIFEALAMLSSAFSVLYFSRTMMVSEKERFPFLPIRMKKGYLYLSLSVFGAVSVFMSAYFLVYMKGRAALVISLVIIVNAILVTSVFLQSFFFSQGLSMVWLRKWEGHSLFKRYDDVVGGVGRSKKVIKSLWLWIMDHIYWLM